MTERSGIVEYIYLVESRDINYIKVWEFWLFYENKVHSKFVDKLGFRYYGRMEVLDGKY